MPDLLGTPRGFLGYVRNPLGYVRRQAVVRGVLGGQRAWLVLGGLAWGVRLLRRVAGTRRLRPVLTEELRPGESLVVSHFPDESR